MKRVGLGRRPPRPARPLVWRSGRLGWLFIIIIINFWFFSKPARPHLRSPPASQGKSTYLALLSLGMCAALGGRGGSRSVPLRAVPSLPAPSATTLPAPGGGRLGRGRQAPPAGRLRVPLAFPPCLPPLPSPPRRHVTSSRGDPPGGPLPAPRSPCACPAAGRHREGEAGGSHPGPAARGSLPGGSPEGRTAGGRAVRHPGHREGSLPRMASGGRQRYRRCGSSWRAPGETGLSCHVPAP